MYKKVGKTEINKMNENRKQFGGDCSGKKWKEFIKKERKYLRLRGKKAY